METLHKCHVFLTEGKYILPATREIIAVYRVISTQGSQILRLERCATFYITVFGTFIYHWILKMFKNVWGIWKFNVLCLLALTEDAVAPGVWQMSLVTTHTVKQSPPLFKKAHSLHTFTSSTIIQFSVCLHVFSRSHRMRTWNEKFR
jgi:capsular polysaccharide biosynthesis protein